MLVPIEQARAGTFDIDSVVCKLSHTPGKVQGPAPLLGEHNEEVLQTFLGMNIQAIDKLYKQGILVQDLEPEQPS